MMSVSSTRPEIPSPVVDVMRSMLGSGAEPLEFERIRSDVTHVRCARFPRGVVVKRMSLARAHIEQQVLLRWLPEAGVESAVSLRATVGDAAGRFVWHIYEDLGPWRLDAPSSDIDRAVAAVRAMARLHSACAGRSFLPEVRLHGRDLGASFYRSNVDEAGASLARLRARGVLRVERRMLLDRLRDRVAVLLDECASRVRALAGHGGPATLLHGDAGIDNVFVRPSAEGLMVHFIDWDHAGAGSAVYDLSTLLVGFPPAQRRVLLSAYQDAIDLDDLKRLPVALVNELSETLELARLADRVIWAAGAVEQGADDWGYEELRRLDEWFSELTPVLELS